MTMNLIHACLSFFILYYYITTLFLLIMMRQLLLIWPFSQIVNKKINNMFFLTKHSKNSTPNLTSRWQYIGPVTCPVGLRWACWTWREAIGWIHWRSNWCFDLIAAYKIPMWLLNKGREKASGIIRYSQCEAQIHISESTFLKCKKYSYYTWNSWTAKHTYRRDHLPTGQWGSEAWQSRRSQKTSRCIRLLWSWVGGVWHQNSSQRQSPKDSLQSWDNQRRRWRWVKGIIYET